MLPSLLPMVTERRLWRCAGNDWNDVSLPMKPWMYTRSNVRLPLWKPSSGGRIDACEELRGSWNSAVDDVGAAGSAYGWRCGEEGGG